MLVREEKTKFQRNEREDFAGDFVGKETDNRHSVVSGFCVSFHCCDSFMTCLNSLRRFSRVNATKQLSNFARSDIEKRQKHYATNRKTKKNETFSPKRYLKKFYIGRF